MSAKLQKVVEFLVTEKLLYASEMIVFSLLVGKVVGSSAGWRK